MAVLAYVQQAPLCMQDRVASRLHQYTSDTIACGQTSRQAATDEQEAKTHGAVQEVWTELESLRTSLCDVQTAVANVARSASVAPSTVPPDDDFPFVFNTTTLFLHSSRTSTRTPSTEWQTKCNWRYSRSSFQHVHVMPDSAYPCPKCFSAPHPANTKNTTPQSSDDDLADSSSSDSSQ